MAIHRNFIFITLLLAYLVVFLLLRNQNQVQVRNLKNSLRAEKIMQLDLKSELESLSTRQLSEASALDPSTTEKPRYTNLRTHELQQLLNCQNHELRLEKFEHGNYWVIKNLVIGSKSRRMGCTESITYTTNGDFTFFDNLETVAERWLAPISFAIHTPGFDLKSTLDSIQYVRNCLPGSQLIQDYVSFHIFFSHDHMPEYVPIEESEALNWPIDCQTMPPPYRQSRSEMYKVKANLTYPINVARNIARKAVNTYFIFACDIELYPSLGFVDQFLDMVHRNNSVLALDPYQLPRVYPLPVFEIAEHERVPDNKTELMDLYRRHRARLFHQRVCQMCHKVPGFRRWIRRAAKPVDGLELFSKTLRQRYYRHWEPVYVSDNKEPYFDERVNWEGKSNKRIQGYAMCLLNYEYHVLHPAFLVHHPGFKRSYEPTNTRTKYVEEMTRLIKSKIEPEYKELFGVNEKCHI